MSDAWNTITAEEIYEQYRHCGLFATRMRISTAPILPPADTLAERKAASIPREMDWEEKLGFEFLAPAVYN